MTDSWEDWENEEYTIPVLNVPTLEQLKRLEERKLEEDSDLQNAIDLFSNDHEDLALQEIQKNTNNSVKKIVKQDKKVSNKKINEEKQKEQSKILKQEKIKKEKAKELYGQADDDNEYAEYEDMFY